VTATICFWHPTRAGCRSQRTQTVRQGQGGEFSWRQSVCSRLDHRSCNSALFTPLRFLAHATAHCSATRMGINPVPLVRAPRALPSTAPGVRTRSRAAMAWPWVGEVVRRSPTPMGP